MSAFKMEYQRISGLDDYIKNVIGALLETKTKLITLQSNSHDINFNSSRKAVINEKMTSILNKTRNLISESENMHQAVSQMHNNVAELDVKYNSRITGIQPTSVASDATMQNMLAQTGTLIAGLTSAILGGVGVATNNGSSATQASHGNNTPKPSQANPYTSDPKEVEKMKKRLNSLGYVGKDGKPLVVNGAFDANALFAMNSFKKKNGISNEGQFKDIVGKQTHDTLFSDKAKKNNIASGGSGVTPASIMGTDGTVYALACSDGGKHRGGLTSKQQQANALYIYNYLSNQGWSKNAICGLLGNIQQESGMNPGVWQSWHKAGKNCGYGLVQWTPAEKKFFSWMGFDTKNQADLADAMVTNSPKQFIDKQLEFLMLNLKPWSGSGYDGEWQQTTSYHCPYKMKAEDYIKSNNDVGELAKVFHGSFERSGDSLEVIEQRSKYAQNWYEYLTNLGK